MLLIRVDDLVRGPTQENRWLNKTNGELQAKVQSLEDLRWGEHGHDHGDPSSDD